MKFLSIIRTGLVLEYHTDSSRVIQGDESASTVGRLSFAITSEKHAAADADPREEDSETPQPEEKTSDVPEESKKHESTKARAVDPLRWYGILVPPALRSAQSNFVSVVESSVPNLATVARDLRDQEIEIGRLRKQMKKL
jgi:hypothetical protein